LSNVAIRTTFASMPRTARVVLPGCWHHVINRGNARATVFHRRSDYLDFLRLMARASERQPIALLGYCLMPNHVHLVLRPAETGDLGRWMQHLLTAHVRRHHLRHGTEGRLWQGRFKAFPILEDAHLYAVLRYVEANALRAGLSGRAEDWPWSSLAARRGEGLAPLAEPPWPLPADWLAIVNEAQPPRVLERLRRSVNRGVALADETVGTVPVDARVNA
jgi:putative transposase